ncbi:glycoside hydrolase family 125 protein [Cercospora zeae-maydis SCOH1-5]|uniref:Glycoside hydrolase family 125 protein n=1 Tax=Cercospora zeae-maydis SCOH1-5 TaxID=717836 RepID=A0A6A6FIG7_9PEZI|nr:glycoside hydrolase family 125 protein [Cercospora zeae-maydis SCOH1-5]
MSIKHLLPGLSCLAASVLAAENLTCPDYSVYSKERHGPYSKGTYHLSYQRPVARCRTFNSSVVEEAIQRIQGEIADPDLKRLFENAYPNTLDTAVKWKGTAAGSEEELTFLITGDIDAMWLRDSANQVQSYLPLLKASSESNSLASLYRGVINLQARYLLIDPYCNSFQPPVESGLTARPNEYASGDTVLPVYNNASVFECKYELDSLAAFLEVSYDYYKATQDAEFFGKYQWVQAIEAVLKTAKDQTVGSYEPDGRVSNLTYQFARESSRSTETQANNGLGNPFNNGTGLVRSFFRPSDDATIYQGLIPSNMMFSRYLAATADIAAKISGQEGLAQRMRDMAGSIKNAISEHGIVEIPDYGKVYAFEVDGYWGQNIMDDANIPSLLSAPLLGYLDVNDEVYQRTRKLILSAQNPYFMRGPVINAIGGPHNGPGYAWPMASIVRILTSSDDAEIKEQLREIVSSTDGLGLIHESINTFNVSDWTRQWFSWANGLFGQAILDLSDRKADILKQSFQ